MVTYTALSQSLNHRFSLLVHNRIAQRISLVCAFALVGTALVMSTRAATPATGVEAESGTMSGASIVSSTGASGGSAVKFGETSLSGASAVYGTGFNMDGVGNLQIGGASSGEPNTYASIRFRAEQTSTLNNIRTYWMGAQFSGYGGGNGGTIRITVQTDNNGVPSGTVLASLDYAPGPVALLFPLLTYSSPPTLAAGTLYHLVFTNIDPSPTVNFVSINGTWVAGSVLSPRQPDKPDGDYALLAKYGSGSWGVRGEHTPIIDLAYANGAHQGQGYMEVEIRNQPLINGGTKYMRERFVVSGGSRTINKGSVRVAKTAGTGNLIVSLENSSGALLDSFSIPANSVPTLNTDNDSSGSWVYGSFSTSHTLLDGQTYYLRLSTDDATTYWSRGIQQGGTAYGFDSTTYFNDGYLQYTTNGGTTWATVPGLEDDGDLQFYLD